MRRYRPSRPWSVGALALAAAAGAVLTAGAIASAVGGGPEASLSERIRQGAASVQPARAHAANPSPSTPSPRLMAGPWQVQAGAFRRAGAAEAHLRALGTEIPELARLDSTHRRRGGVERVRIGGFADRAAARRLCERLLASGRECFVVGPEG